jgi:hypothetical protein
MSFGTVISARRLPLIWIGSVTVSSTSSAGSAFGPGRLRTSPSPPSIAQISSARCGTIGDISCASVRIAARLAAARGRLRSVLVKA